MTPVRASLQRLNAALGTLETSVDQLEGSLTGKQRDMFSSPSNENGAGGNSVGKDKELIAQRLDVAIEKVEKLLTESA